MNWTNFWFEVEIVVEIRYCTLCLVERFAEYRYCLLCEEIFC